MNIQLVPAEDMVRSKKERKKANKKTEKLNKQESNELIQRDVCEELIRLIPKIKNIKPAHELLKDYTNMGYKGWRLRYVKSGLIKEQRQNLNDFLDLVRGTGLGGREISEIYNLLKEDTGELTPERLQRIIFHEYNLIES